jgi:hypothetical protein
LAENWKTEKIGVTALCRISAKGGEGIYLYIPKHFASAYGLVGADYAEVRFTRIFIKIAEADIEKKPSIVDLRGRERKKPS